MLWVNPMNCCAKVGECKNSPFRVLVIWRSQDVYMIVPFLFGAIFLLFIIKWCVLFNKNFKKIFKDVFI